MSPVPEGGEQNEGLPLQGAQLDANQFGALGSPLDRPSSARYRDLRHDNYGGAVRRAFAQ